VLQRQIQAVQKAMHNVAPGQLAQQENAEAFDAQAAAAAVARLGALLEASDGDATEAFSAVDKILAGTVEKAPLDALGTAISKFDFEGALVKLHEIIKQWGAKWV
jgi:hypothetical protein